MEIETQINKFMAPYIEKNKRLLVGVSGGADSIYLSYVLNKSKFDIVIAHFNHNLRGKESDFEEKFVKQFSKNLHVPFYSKKWKHLKKNISELKALPMFNPPMKKDGECLY